MSENMLLTGAQRKKCYVSILEMMKYGVGKSEDGAKKMYEREQK